MKIKKTDIEIVKLTSKEILLTLFDLTTPFYEASRMYRKSIRKYLEQRSIDRSNFLYKIKYLRQKGYIETFIERKERFAELTIKGKKHSQLFLLENLTIPRPKRWDGKWRVVVFDVPEKWHRKRDIFRDYLKRLNFIKIQQSVYVYPFECTNEIALLSSSLSIDPYVIIMVSEIIQGEDKIIKNFIDSEVLSTRDLKKTNG